MSVTPLAPPPADPDLIEACGVDPGAVCEAVWERTENTALATVADWLIGIPLAIIAVVVVAWILVRMARRAVRKAVHRVVVTDRDIAVRALQRLNPNSASAATVTVEDPRRVARAASISAVVASTVTVLIWVVACFLVLGELGIDLAPLIAGAGIAGVALGFGAQSLVKDCLSGLFMLIEDQFGIGDVVDLGEASGVVERITLRATVLRSLDGTVWHVPNGVVQRVGNKSQLFSVAVLDVVVGYDADVARARLVLHDAAVAVTGSDEFAGEVLEAPEVLGVEAATADGVTLRLLVKTTPGSQFRLQRVLREAVKLSLDDAGIRMPPPLRSMGGREDPPPP